MTTEQTPFRPACDYELCPRHFVDAEGGIASLKRGLYCTTECRDNQRKLKYNQRRVRTGQA